MGPVANGRFAVFREKSMDVYSLEAGEKFENVEGEWLKRPTEMQVENQRMYQYRAGFLRAFDLTSGKTIWVRNLGIKKDLRESYARPSSDGHPRRRHFNWRRRRIHLSRERRRWEYSRSHRIRGIHFFDWPAFIFGDGVILSDQMKIVIMRPHSIRERSNPFL